MAKWGGDASKVHYEANSEVVSCGELFPSPNWQSKNFLGSCTKAENKNDMSVAGIEPASTRPQRDVLPLNYTDLDVEICDILGIYSIIFNFYINYQIKCNEPPSV